MKRMQRNKWHRATAIVAGVIGIAMTPSSNVIEDSRAVYWFFSLNDAAEIQFHGSALNDAIAATIFLQSLPSDSAGTLYLMIEGSTGWFLDTPEPADGVVSTSESVSEGAAAAAVATPMETEKTRSVDLMRIWAHDDDFNDVATWTLHSVELVGHSMGSSYVVLVNYLSAEVSPVD